VASIIIVGDGPGGLSAALFLAKNGEDVHVFGTDQTAMNFALLRNYLGIPEISGAEFQAVARTQATSQGAALSASTVEAIAPLGDGFAVRTDDGAEHHADYIVLSEGRSPELAPALGVATDPQGDIVLDADHRTSVDRVYVVGRSARPRRSQAIISAGAGAVAALDILSRERGEDFQDWDSPPKD